MRILCLHTADVHVETFGRLYASAAPDAVVTHVVRADWLDAARRDGLTDPLQADVAAFLVDSARANDAVLCTCSTLGPIAETAQTAMPNIVRIDRPVMDRAAAYDGVVLVAFCLESTRAATIAALEAAFARIGKGPRFDIVHCAGAWSFFECGNREGFAASIASTVRRELAAAVAPAAVVLAQASMAVAEARLADCGVPVLSSPRLAVAATVRLGATSVAG